jgi:hypothetical protein
VETPPRAAGEGDVLALGKVQLPQEGTWDGHDDLAADAEELAYVEHD